MIQANELRIGNWVETVLSDKPQRVGSITAQQVKNGTFYLINTLLQDHLDPITLTPEILEKCGFEKPSDETSGFLSVDFDKSYITAFDRKRLILCLDDNGLRQINTYWVENIGMPEVSLTFNIKYLHQLQNLYFDLTGEELKINL